MENTYDNPIRILTRQQRILKGTGEMPNKDLNELLEVVNEKTHRLFMENMKKELHDKDKRE